MMTVEHKERFLCADCGINLADPGESICTACETHHKTKPCSWPGPEKKESVNG